jgi:hypothetical protein
MSARSPNGSARRPSTTTMRLLVGAREEMDGIVNAVLKL